MHPRARTRFTVAEYLAVDAVSDQKNEYVDGYILGQPVTGRAHNLITANICVALGTALRGERRWEVYGCNQRVGDVGRGWFAYPDGVVACAPVAFDGRTLLELGRFAVNCVSSLRSPLPTYGEPDARS